MNPLLINQILQLLEWGLTGALDLKENDAYNGQYKPALEAALAANQPIDDATWASLSPDIDAAHNAVQNG